MDNREHARRVRRRLEQQVSDLRARRDLSDEGRQRQIAKVTSAAKSELRDLRLGEQTAIVDRREELLNQLSRSDTAASSYRAAQDRADQPTSASDALRLLQRAQRSGDHELIRALVARAHGLAMPGAGDGWSQVRDTGAASLPGAVDILDELRGLEADDTPAARVKRSILTGMGSGPRELDKVPDIDALARQADAS